VDGTLKSVTASEEFAATLNALRAHVEETDKVLREMAKPRKIRLVESGPQAVKSAPEPTPAPAPAPAQQQG
jgi:hypothetical protein